MDEHASTDTQQSGMSPTPRRLTRRPEGKVLFGVCSGLGVYTGVDPVLWRIGFVVLTFVSGLGLIAYIVAIFVMPMADEGEPARTLDTAQTRTWIGIGALVLGVAILLGGVWPWGRGAIVGVLLIGVGLALWSRDLGPARGPRPESRQTPPSGELPPEGETPPHSAAVSPPERGAGAVPPSGPPPQAPATRPPPPTPPVPPAPRERSVLGRLTVGTAALVLGVLLLLGNAGFVRLTPAIVVAVLLVVLGSGLLIGSLWGRARWLIIPGAVLSLVLLAMTIVPVHAIRGGMGEVRHEPGTTADVQRSYELGAGKMTVDLSDVTFRTSRTIEARLGFGELLVLVPENIETVVNGRVQGGQMNLFGTRSDGWNVSRTVRSEGESPRPLLTIDATVTFGEITVGRSGEIAELPDRRGRDRGPWSLLEGGRR